jgi:hypothetical protein
MTIPTEQDALERLLRDVVSTVGPEYAPEVHRIVAHARTYPVSDLVTKCVNDVQQYLHDTFVDTTWPACPRHPNHPLEHRAGAWYCPKSGAVAAPLGGLESLRPD